MLGTVYKVMECASIVMYNYSSNQTFHISVLLGYVYSKVMFTVILPTVQCPLQCQEHTVQLK